MQLNSQLSVIAFFLVPFFVWMLAALTAWRKAGDQRLSKKLAMTATAFVAGADGRLSLSRLQAFAWTLVIFGAYAAAFVVHVPYTVGTAAESAKADTTFRTAKSALERIESSRDDLAAKSGINSETLKELQLALDDSARYLKKLEAERGADPAADAARAAHVATMRATLLDLTARVQAASQAVKEDRAKLTAANSERSIAAASLMKYKVRSAELRWVSIPVALLALAGLSIGTGVFSSLISNVSGEDKNACVTAVQSLPYSELDKTQFPELGTARSPSWPCAMIYGRDLGKSGYVRFGSTYADVLYWASNERLIIVQMPPGFVKAQTPDIDDTKVRGQLVVDTPNGKRVYAIQSIGGALSLGESATSYDWLDLFRDDRNPAALALTKFQMFGWTVVALLMYSYTVTRIIAGEDAAYLSALPDVDSSLVVLMGVSQAAYLIGKAVSGVSPAPTPQAGNSPPATMMVTQPTSSVTAVTVPPVARSAPPGPLPEE
jgi:hypothetical protein